MIDGTGLGSTCHDIRSYNSQQLNSFNIHKVFKLSLDRFVWTVISVVVHYTFFFPVGLSGEIKADFETKLRQISAAAIKAI